MRLACIHPYNTYIHTYTHTHIHTYIHDKLVHKTTIVKRFYFHHTKAIANCQSAIFDEFQKACNRKLLNNRTLSMGYSLGMVEIAFLILCTRLFVYIILLFECVCVCVCVCVCEHV